MLIEKKPISQKRLDANRRNALKSSGPASARGRAISSQNARKYELLPFENPALPARLTAQYYGRFIPSSKRERRLVDIMVYSERVFHYCSPFEIRRRSQASSLPETPASAFRRLAMMDAAESAYSNSLRLLESFRSRKAA